MSMIPTSPLAERRQKFVRKLGMAVSGLMVVLVVTIFALVLRSESAHDEASCPFQELSERKLKSATVREQMRACVPEAEEHRWLLSRDGKPEVELGRKRLPKERFTATRTKWTLSPDEGNEVILRIEVDGQMLSEFREADLAH